MEALSISLTIGIISLYRRGDKLVKMSSLALWQRAEGTIRTAPDLLLSKELWAGDRDMSEVGMVSPYPWDSAIYYSPMHLLCPFLARGAKV